MLPPDFQQRVKICAENTTISGLGVAFYLAGCGESLRSVDPQQAADYLEKKFRCTKVPQEGSLVLWYKRGGNDSIDVSRLATITKIKEEKIGWPFAKRTRDGDIEVAYREDCSGIEYFTLNELTKRCGDRENGFYQRK